MTGAIIVVTFSFYILQFIFALGSWSAGGMMVLVVLVVPPLAAGLFGGMQYARTERRGMRMLSRLACALKSCLAIVFTPLLISFVLILVSIIGSGFGFLFAVPDMAAFLTLAGLIQMGVFTLYGLPAIFIGLTAGQWLQFKRMTR
ncbi:hypothetical protein BC777_1667 [Yoonia maricola]|uniref:Uncharacterized protein n=1 Tax=Yoonia maricola TaxID=420999 RepID=A0A2M8WPE3_9RHOB|nr:hypothetical protein [Yoonia maricola]PJI92805.1 hypothetical protein BC777_1667 [Yoonia maricola]